MLLKGSCYLLGKIQLTYIDGFVMQQHIFIDNWVSLSANTSLNDEVPLTVPARFEKTQLPKLDWVKPMQRRRLSPFAKMALYCAHQAAGEIKPLPSVFSSRHGDLHKTSMLLDDLAEGEALSPTAFSLSVHNAVSGLFTILTENQQATNTVVAGKNTLLMAIVDGYARIKSGLAEQMLVVHCDQALPEIYLPDADEYQIDHAVAFVLSEQKLTPSSIKIDLAALTSALESNSHDIPQALRLGQWLAEQRACSTKC